MKKRVTIKELIDILEKIEGERITDAGIRKSLYRSGIRAGADHMVDTAKALEARKLSKLNDKSKEPKPTNNSSFASVSDARVEKIRLECVRLQIEIDKLNEKLVERTEVEAAFRKIAIDLKSCVMNLLIKEIAIRPEIKEQIEMLKDALFLGIHEKFNSR